MRNTCCNPFLPFDFCPPDASPPVRHSGQLTSHHVVVHVGRPAITTISYARLTPPPSQAPRGSTWMQTERPIARAQKTHRGPKDLPRSEHLWNDRLCPPAGSCAGNMGKFSKMGLLLFSFTTKIEERDGAPIQPAQGLRMTELTGLDICFQRRRRVDSFPAFLHSFSPAMLSVLLSAVCGLMVLHGLCLVV